MEVFLIVAKAARRKQIRINSIPILEESGYYYGFKIPKLLKNKKEIDIAIER